MEVESEVSDLRVTTCLDEVTLQRRTEVAPEEMRSCLCLKNKTANNPRNVKQKSQRIRGKRGLDQLTP